MQPRIEALKLIKASPFMKKLEASREIPKPQSLTIHCAPQILRATYQ